MPFERYCTGLVLSPKRPESQAYRAITFDSVSGQMWDEHTYVSTMTRACQPSIFGVGLHIDSVADLYAECPADIQPGTLWRTFMG